MDELKCGNIQKACVVRDTRSGMQDDAYRAHTHFERIRMDTSGSIRVSSPAGSRSSRLAVPSTTSEQLVFGLRNSTQETEQRTKPTSQNEDLLSLTADTGVFGNRRINQPHPA